jgi:signal peptidase
MSLRSAVETAATIVVVAVWFFALRPVALGGPTSYIVVRGYSMSGTLAPGDLVVTMAQSKYSVGDTIVYRAPVGPAKGILVVHRIVGADPPGYRMQGDANSYQDPWSPKTSDVVGKLVVALPGLGRMVSSLASPIVLSMAWGMAALIVGLSFLPDSPVSMKRRKRRRMGQTALNAASAAALTFMIGLVVLSAVAVVSPANATGLNVHNQLITSRVVSCPPPPTYTGSCT